MMESRETNIILLGLLVLLLAFFTSEPLYVGYVTKQCSDGDGNNLFYRGKVIVTGNEEAWDTCAGDNVVQEFSCTDGTLHFAFETCEGGCVNGACHHVVEKHIASDGKTYMFESGNDRVEVNEYLGDVVSTFTEDDISELQGELVSTSRGSTEIHQYLHFSDVTTGRVIFAEDEDNHISDMLYFDNDNYLFSYELEFEGGLRSRVDGTDLHDFDDTKLHLFGREYTLVEGTKQGDVITLRLVGGDYSDLIKEGETKIYVTRGKEHTITLVTLDDTQRKVTLEIDGTLSKQLSQGEIFYLGDEIFGVGDLYVHESSEGTDFAKIFISARTLTFKDDASDSSFTTGVEIDGTSLSEGRVSIRGSLVQDEYRVSSLTYRLQPNPEHGSHLYIPPGHGAREYLETPAAFLGPWDITYGGLDDEGTTSLVFDPSGSQYDLKFTNRKQQSYALGVAHNVENSLYIRDDGHDVHFLEAASSSTFTVNQEEYFIVTSENTKSGLTNILRYDSIDTASKTLHLDELAEGGKTVTYTGTEGTDAAGELIVSGKTYRVFVGGAPDYGLAVDLDGDGDVDGSEVNIIIDGGGILDLGSSLNPGGNVDFTLTTDGSQLDENTTDETITLRIVTSGNGIDLELNSQSSLTIETESSKTKAMSRYGVLLEKDNGNPDRLTIAYPRSQSFADVRLVFSPEKISSISSTTTDCGNGVCDDDEGFMTCSQDCEEISFEEEQPVVVQDTCGNGVCESGEDCPQDCIVYEKPAVVEEPQGFWTRVWGWITALFS